MEWAYFRCDWCDTIYRTDAREPLSSCTTCGADVSIAEEPGGGNWVTDVYLPEGEEPDSPGVLGPLRPLMPGSRGQEREIAAVARRGTPILLEPSSDAGRLDTAAVLHVTDLMLLASSTAPNFVVRRVDARGDKHSGLVPPPEPVVLLRIYEARNKTGDTFSITEHRIGFSGVPFEGNGRTPEEAWEEFENELDACENWLDLPESTRMYSSPIAFLWLKEARQTGDLREKFGPALNE